jgi:hypothetical protein
MPAVALSTKLVVRRLRRLGVLRVRDGLRSSRTNSGGSNSKSTRGWLIAAPLAFSSKSAMVVPGWKQLFFLRNRRETQEDFGQNCEAADRKGQILTLLVLQMGSASPVEITHCLALS